MGTVATVQVVSPGTDVTAALHRALGWFAVVEAAASRFDPNSELRRLVERVGEPVAVSPVLFEALRFALALAELTDGAFDPTVGRALQARGFDQHHVTGRRDPAADLDPDASWRDVELDEAARTVTLGRRLLLDLGAVAKGFAIDLAARELSGFAGAMVEAGGDLHAAGVNADGQPWQIGVQDPFDPDGIADVLVIENAAVCTSGTYEKGQHLVTAYPDTFASVSVVAPTAMVADGLATAAFVLGPEAGPRLLEEQGVAGLFITASGERRSTGDLRRPS